MLMEGVMKRAARILAVSVVGFAGLAAVAPATGHGIGFFDHLFPARIALPNGWQPEGIVIGNGAHIYAGSTATGAVFRADLRTGRGVVLVPPQTGRVAVGLKLDHRTDLLFVAGGATGSAYVYDADNGASVAAIQLTTATETFVNDAVVTRNAVYFTDSFRAALYRVPLERDGDLPDPPAVEEIPLGGDFMQVAGQFNANGIESAFDGRALIVVNSTLGTLYRVDPTNGVTSLIDLGGGSVVNGDGILLRGRTLFVVQNQLNQVAVVDLDFGLTSGRVVRTITDASFDVPTTIDSFGRSLYVVNARFSTPPTPDTTYDIVRVPIFGRR
jgi:sugar lactone lactonase YvrE